MANDDFVFPDETAPPEKMWRKYTGTTAEEMCAAIRELWLAKYPNYIRMLNEVPNRLIEEEAAMTLHLKHVGRGLLKDLEKFLDKQPFGDHFSDDLLGDELYWKDPDAPLSEYVEADKRKDALIKKYSVGRKQMEPSQ